MQQSFEGIRACGKYVIAEHCGMERQTRSGIVAPEGAATNIWRVISVGPENTTGVQVGERIGFVSANEMMNNGRKYAAVAPDQLLFALPFPAEEAEEEERRIVLATAGLQ